MEALCQQVGVRVGVYPFAGMGTAIEAASGSMHIVTDYRPRRPAADRGDPQSRLVRVVKRLLGRDDAYVPRAKYYRLPEVRALLAEVFGNPFRPVAFDPAWRTSTAVALAARMYDSRDFSPMPILADALQDAGCDDEDVLGHCRSEESHVLGCCVIDLVLSKE